MKYKFIRYKQFEINFNKLFCLHRFLTSMNSNIDYINQLNNTNNNDRTNSVTINIHDSTRIDCTYLVHNEIL